jgi:hypothetical protein
MVVNAVNGIPEGRLVEEPENKDQIIFSSTSIFLAIASSDKV